MSNSPAWLPVCTAGTPPIGSGCNEPFFIRRSRPTRSVTNIEPSGKNAIDQG